MKKIIQIFLFCSILITAALVGIFSQAAANESSKEDIELKNKIGQMLIIGFRGTEINADSYITKTIQELNIGGVVLCDKDMPSQGKLTRNIINPVQTRQLISDLKKYSPTALFVAVDAEGGYVNRLKAQSGFIKIPSAEELGRGTPAKTETIGNLLGAELSILGFNLNFAPVVDVNINPNNPVIGYLERSFSNDPKKVSIYAEKFINGLHNYNIATVIKHFPGHGSSTSDSHLGLVDITKTWTPQELIPYIYLLKNNYSDAIMTAHIMNTAIDPDYPATLSPIFINGLLRNVLGFKGLVISDDMQMGAIADNFGFEESIIRAINAGCDILIISNNLQTYDEQIPYKAVDAIFKAVKNGQISEEKINASYNKIINFKNYHGIKN